VIEVRVGNPALREGFCGLEGVEDGDFVRETGSER